MRNLRKMTLSFLLIGGGGQFNIVVFDKERLEKTIDVDVNVPGDIQSFLFKRNLTKFT